MTKNTPDRKPAIGDRVTWKFGRGEKSGTVQLVFGTGNLFVIDDKGVSFVVHLELVREKDNN
jgi:hypothetical protein